MKVHTMTFETEIITVIHGINVYHSLNDGSIRYHYHNEDHQYSKNLSLVIVYACQTVDVHLFILFSHLYYCKTLAHLPSTYSSSMAFLWVSSLLMWPKYFSFFSISFISSNLYSYDYYFIIKQSNSIYTIYKNDILNNP